MAVQAQYPSIAFRINNNNVWENFHDQDNLQYGHHHDQVLFKNGTVLFSDPESELTCNFVSASTRKRKSTTSTSTTTRGGNYQMHHHHHLNPQNQNQHQHQYQHQHQENVSSHNYNYYNNNNNNNYYFPSSRTTKLPKVDQVLVSTICVKKSFEENRLNQSEGASTSGRRRSIRSRYHDDDNDEDAVLLAAVSSPQVPPPLLQHSQHLNSYYLLHQNLDDEIEALIRFQHETLRSVVEQNQQIQCRLLLSVLEQQVVGRLKEKQIELENACGRNAELQEKVEQMSSENKMWFNVAKNNEAMLLSLSSTLQHQLLNLQSQKTTMRLGLGGGGGQGTKVEEEEAGEEGFGDSSDIGVAPDDAQSANNNNNCHQLLVNVGEREYKTATSNIDVRDNDDDASMMMKQKQKQQQHRKMCKVCEEKEVCVLLLPCRHLCLCKDCEAKLQTCPICKSFMNASLQIFMS